jgi:hypothetical protein
MNIVNADVWARWWSQTGELELVRLLLRHWDVVGVRETDIEPEREYVYEASRLAAILRAGATEADVEKALGALGRDMSVDPDHQRDAQAAEAIVAWYRNTARGYQPESR